MEAFGKFVMRAIGILLILTITTLPVAARVLNVGGPEMLQGDAGRTCIELSGVLLGFALLVGGVASIASTLGE